MDESKKIEFDSNSAEVNTPSKHDPLRFELTQTCDCHVTLNIGIVHWLGYRSEIDSQIDIYIDDKKNTQLKLNLSLKNAKLLRDRLNALSNFFEIAQSLEDEKIQEEEQMRKNNDY